MKRVVSILILISAVVIGARAQEVITWDDLTDIRFEEKYFEEIEEHLLFPTFGPGVTKWDKKEIQITGFIIPIEADQTVYVLSQNPYSSCFFCGQAGPETIMELHLKEPPRKMYELDDIMTFRGRLELNDSDIDHCNYILKDAEVVK